MMFYSAFLIVNKKSFLFGIHAFEEREVQKKCTINRESFCTYKGIFLLLLLKIQQKEHIKYRLFLNQRQRSDQQKKLSIIRATASTSVACTTVVGYGEAVFFSQALSKEDVSFFSKPLSGVTDGPTCSVHTRYNRHFSHCSSDQSGRISFSYLILTDAVDRSMTTVRPIILCSVDFSIYSHVIATRRLSFCNLQ